MKAFFEFIGEIFGSLSHWFSTNQWTTGKTKVLILVFGVILGGVAISLLKDSNSSKNRLHFEVEQYVQIPGAMYENLSAPEFILDKLGDEGKLNVKYNFSYSYLDSNKRNSKAVIIATCPTEYVPKVISCNQSVFQKSESKSGNTSIYFEVTPIAEKTSGHIELQLQIKSAKRFDIEVFGRGYDKPLFGHDKEGYTAGTAKYTFTVR
ncbi:MAG: hypothetical protein IJP61_12410 [Treponema sp.]|nr:hypothetical protein [Treponema sp.]